MSCNCTKLMWLWYDHTLLNLPCKQHPPSYDDIEPSIPSVTIIPANVQDDDIPPPIPANVQDDDIPPPIPAKTNKTSYTTKQMSNDKEITGGLTSPSHTSTSEGELILEVSIAPVTIYIHIYICMYVCDEMH